MCNIVYNIQMEFPSASNSYIFYRIMYYFGLESAVWSEIQWSQAMLMYILEGNWFS